MCVLSVKAKAKATTSSSIAIAALEACMRARVPRQRDAVWVIGDVKRQQRLRAQQTPSSLLLVFECMACALRGRDGEGAEEEEGMKKMRCCCFQTSSVQAGSDGKWWKRQASTPGSSSRAAASCLCVWAGGGCRVHCVGALVAVGLRLK